MKYLVIAFIVLIAGSVSGYYFLNSRIEDIKKTNPVSTSSDNVAMIEENKLFTLSDIKNHNTPENCWFVVKGTVYDVTQYIKDQKHPGKDAILKGCGIDATELYTTKVGRGENHSDNAYGYMENFKIGMLSPEATPSSL